MKQLFYARRFKRDYKLVKKRGYNLERLQAIIELLVADDPLPERCRPHKLVGNYAGYWECHIEPDWLLIYDVTDDEIELAATGTHSDLFE